jgi:hypothetical protein
MANPIMVRITEGDQLVMHCTLAAVFDQNQFIRSLVADALVSEGNTAERQDSEGCTVTAVVELDRC